MLEINKLRKGLPEDLLDKIASEANMLSKRINLDVWDVEHAMLYGIAIYNLYLKDFQEELNASTEPSGDNWSGTPD